MGVGKNKLMSKRGNKKEIKREEWKITDLKPSCFALSHYCGISQKSS